MSSQQSLSSVRSGGTAPELLAPAGDAQCLAAAIENGADAVYFGLDCGFNARNRAANFTPESLADVMATLHRRGVRGYVTLNTLVFTNELDQVVRLLLDISAAGVDAVLVQDLGLAQVARQTVPDLPLHASTQMTLTSAEGIAVAQSLGIERVVLGRELSIAEIRKIAASTSMPLECFVHGALCVAYSGQCLTSESLGGRSANRGQCAQACRLPYDLIVDGSDRDLGQQKYLLSPQDLAAYRLVPDLIDAGICSLKIEGRLKTPEYVANITRHYRQAIDQAMESRSVHLTPQQVQEMELSFSRGFSHGWLEGCDHKELVPGLSSAKRGILAGRVVSVRDGKVEIQAEVPLHRGDGVAFEGDRVHDRQQGGRLYDVQAAGPDNSRLLTLRFAAGAIDWNQVWPGQAVWKNDDPQLNRRLAQSFHQSDPVRRRKLSVHVRAAVGDVLRVSATLGQATIELVSDQAAELARKHPLSRETLLEQLGRLGGTAYELDSLSVEIEGSPMLPLSVLGRLRHEMVARLDAASIAVPERRQFPEKLNDLRQRVLEIAGPRESEPRENKSQENNQRHSDHPTLHVLCRSLEQLPWVIDCGIRRVYVDFHDPRQYGQAVAIARAADCRITLATPRIQKPGEMGLMRVMLRHQADGYLVRNLASMQYFLTHGGGADVVGDFSLNVTNELSAALLIEQGIVRFAPSYDLNRQQLLDLIQAVPSRWAEVVVHQHMPMFHMEHCVFCSVISPGTNKTNCGRPCDRHLVKLRDRAGIEHPLHADIGCRNTLFNGQAQSGSEAVAGLIDAGVGDFRIELLEQSEAAVKETVSLYQRLLAGEITGKQVWTRLQAANRVGVTRGTLEEKRNPLKIL